MAVDPSLTVESNDTPCHHCGTPPRFSLVVIAGIVALVAWVLFGDAWKAGAAELDGGVANTIGSCEPLPIAMQHRYRMSAKARPLLFWVARHNVGEAQAVWRRDPAGGRAYELLIGSDPAKAPMKINRWGYIAEQVHGAEACVLGVMKESGEASVEEAKSRLASEGRNGRFVFKAIRAMSTADEARAGVSTVSVARNLTLHDLPALLEMLASPTPGTPMRSVPLPPSTRPGFLVAMAELVHANVEGYHRSADSFSRPSNLLTYIYNGTLNDLTLRRAARVREWRLDGRAVANVVRASFESRNRRTGQLSKFELVYGTEGPLAEVPLHATYQPNWWFHVELSLADPGV